MATIISHNLQISHNAEYFVFLDETGIQPATNTGYASQDDLNTYTGSIDFINADTKEIVATYTVSPTNGKSKDTIYFNSQGNSTTKLPSGVYLTKFTVKDSAGSLIGTSEKGFVNLVDVISSLQIVMERELVKPVGEFNKRSLVESYEYMVASKMLIGAGNINGASSMFMGIKNFLDQYQLIR